MTLDELAAETLVQKHRRLMQEKCKHDGVYTSTVTGPDGTFPNSVCLDCGNAAFKARAALPTPKTAESER